MDSWRDRLWYRFNFWAMWPAFTLGFSLRTAGCHNMPRTGPALILANHESFLDPPLIGLAVRRKIHYAARKTLFKPPSFAAYLRSMGAFPIDQEGVAKEGVRTIIDLLRAGKALVFFPEGERTPTGEMLPFKPGIQLVLNRYYSQSRQRRSEDPATPSLPFPIVPVGIAGAYEAFPRHARVPRLSPLFWTPTGASIAVSVGKPIPPERYRAVQRDGLLDFLFDQIQAQVRQAEKMVRKVN